MMATILTELSSELTVIFMFALTGLQFIVWSNDSLCGLSGADSIVRNFVAALDTSSAIVFFAATCTFAFNSPGANQNARGFLKRWSKLHSDPNQNMKEGIKVDIRSSSFPRLRNVTRIGKIKVARRSNDQLTYGDAYEELVENYSSFLVPYIIPKKSTFDDTRICLSQDAVRGAASKTIARFASFMTWTFVFWAVRLSYLLYSLWNNRWQMLIHITSETSRAILVSCQTLSLVTYSLQYKGVSSWGSPPSRDGGGRTGRFWEANTQESFRARVIAQIGRYNPALITFLLADWAWPHLPSWLKAQIHPNSGPTLFSCFADPPEDAYSDSQTSVQMKLEIFEGHEIDRNRKPIRTIEFTHVPGVLRYEMQTALHGTPIYRVSIIPIGLCALFGLVGPYVFAILHPTPAVKMYYLVEQVMVWLLRYDDVPERSINSKFETEDIYNRSPWI